MSGVETDETRDLISSDKVEGTSVYDRNGNNLGTISNVMLDKRSGQVA
jgi:sporulation protein YlmC with PRC-barrel domain